jgi:hypothetical protein
MLISLSTQPELCRSFHLKVFGKPYDEPIKKARKPKFTRARPSADLEPAPMRRSVSHDRDPRSRSASVDTVGRRPLVRAPSGKDLFKGREVGLRRTASAILRKDKPEMLAPTMAKGLFGRKVSDKSREADDSNTLVFATPLKPKPNRYTPTPAESPFPSWVGDTPQSRIAETPQQRVAETPQSRMLQWDSEDPMGDLMVMTDEEDQVPDTPE